jgi:hypothetical protein
MAPWGEEESVVRGWGFFVGCKSWMRKRVLCENEVFIGCKSGERKRVLGGRGYLWPEEPIQPLFKKLLPKD